jgi:hypothetical protein
MDSLSTLMCLFAPFSRLRHTPLLRLCSVEAGVGGLGGPLLLTLMVRRREFRPTKPDNALRRDTRPDQIFAGDYCAGDTPVPISNTAVKPCRADGTAGEIRWESTSSPAYI